jgi:signal transduction histidine kinase
MPKSNVAPWILVVDDNPATLKILGALLEEAGMRATLVTSAAAARGALDALPEGRSGEATIDLVLSDISMPGESGFELLEWIKRDGSRHRELPVLLTTTQLPEAENRVKGLAMGAVDYVVRPVDLSELVIRTRHAVDSYRRMRALETSLQSSEHLATVGRLLAASNHEIKNLAALVDLAVGRVLTAFGDRSDDPALAALEQSSRLLLDVARSVSSLLSAEATPVRTLDLAELAAEVIELMRPRVDPVFIKLVAPVQPVHVSGHAVRLKQVLVNLILNAADAIREWDAGDGGTIEVRVEIAAGRPQVAVVDNGIGLGEAGRRVDFKPFSTTKKLRGGTGLGLWLCATLARNMGGELSLASAGPGLGATATLVLSAGSKDDDLDLSAYLLPLDPLGGQ